MCISCIMKASYKRIKVGTCVIKEGDLCVFWQTLKVSIFQVSRYIKNYTDIDKSLQMLIMESMIFSGWRNVLREFRIY